MKTDDSGHSITNRMYMVFGLLLLMPLAIGLQILRIQVLDGSQLRQLWSQQAMDVIPVPAQRGTILDREGRELAGNAVTHTVALDPHYPGVTSEQIRLFTSELAKVGTRTQAAYNQRIRTASPSSRYIVLERNLSTESVDQLRDLNIRAAIFEEQYRRRYNFGPLASHAIGYVNHELNGMSGLESYYNRYLGGVDGSRQVRRDRSGRIRAYVGAPRRKPQQGHTLITTLDAHIQAIAEEELKKGIDRAMAKSGSIIIMDPRTGAVRAMAGYPSFDPNQPAASPPQNRRNRIISDQIEPGSTFKLVTAVAAMEKGYTRLDEQFDTGEGRRIISGQMMRDHDPLGTISFFEAIQKSSNIATSEVAGRIPSDILYQYARNLGFGSLTFIDLPGEEPGILRKPWQWSAVSKPWISIGYEVQVNLMQLAQAYAAFANEGVIMRPYLVDRVIDESGREIYKNQPETVRRAIRPETIEMLRPVFESVVTDSGTAAIARIDGFRVAGKTGTAQKYIDGRYRTQYIATFAGFFPADQPRYICLVMLDEPRLSYYGGFISGPVFRNVALRLIGLDDELHIAAAEDKAHTGAAASDRSGSAASDRSGMESSGRRGNTASDINGMAASGHNRQAAPGRLGMAAPGLRSMVAPDLRGMHRNEAMAVLDDFRIRYRSAGEGNYITEQDPRPGEEIPNTAYMHLLFSHSIITDTTRISPDHHPVPDIRGMSMRKASAWLRKSGFEVEMVGSGTVYAQFPLAGEQYRTGQTVTIRGRARDLPAILSQRGI